MQTTEVEQEQSSAEKNNTLEPASESAEPVVEQVAEVELASVKKLTAVHEASDGIDPAAESLATDVQAREDASYRENTKVDQEAQPLSTASSKPDVHELRAQIKKIEQTDSDKDKHQPKIDKSTDNSTSNLGAQDDSEEVKRFTLSEMSPQHWISLNKALHIKGILSSTVSNAVLVSCDHNVLHFVLDETKASLFDTSHSRRLSDILSDYFNEPVKATIELGPTPVELETPADYHVRKQKEMRIEAIDILNNDEVVANLREHFGATLDENSIEIE